MPKFRLLGIVLLIFATIALYVIIKYPLGFFGGLITGILFALGFFLTLKGDIKSKRKD